MAGHVHVTAKEFYDIFGDSDEENDGEEDILTMVEVISIQWF